jgi:hypothetical protein
VTSCEIISTMKRAASTGTAGVFGRSNKRLRETANDDGDAVCVPDAEVRG